MLQVLWSAGAARFAWCRVQAGATCRQRHAEASLTSSLGKLDLAEGSAPRCHGQPLFFPWHFQHLFPSVQNPTQQGARHEAQPAFLQAAAPLSLMPALQVAGWASAFMETFRGVL